MYESWWFAQEFTWFALICTICMFANQCESIVNQCESDSFNLWLTIYFMFLYLYFFLYYSFHKKFLFIGICKILSIDYINLCTQTIWGHFTPGGRNKAILPLEQIWLLQPTWASCWLPSEMVDDESKWISCSWHWFWLFKICLYNFNIKIVPML